MAVARETALSAFWASSRRTPSVRACACRAVAICASVLVNSNSVRSWAVIWVVIVVSMHFTTPAKPSVDRSKSADRDGFHRQKGWCHPSGRIWSRRLCARTGNRDKDTRVLSAGPAGVLTAQRGRPRGPAWSTSTPCGDTTTTMEASPVHRRPWRNRLGRGTSCRC